MEITAVTYNVRPKHSHVLAEFVKGDIVLAYFRYYLSPSSLIPTLPTGNTKLDIVTINVKWHELISINRGIPLSSFRAHPVEVQLDGDTAQDQGQLRGYLQLRSEMGQAER